MLRTQYIYIFIYILWISLYTFNFYNCITEKNKKVTVLILSYFHIQYTATLLQAFHVCPHLPLQAAPHDYTWFEIFFWLRLYPLRTPNWLFASRHNPVCFRITKETCRLCRPCPRCRLEKASKLLPGTWQKNTTSILINPGRMT